MWRPSIHVTIAESGFEVGVHWAWSRQGTAAHPHWPKMCTYCSRVWKIDFYTKQECKTALTSKLILNSLFCLCLFVFLSFCPFVFLSFFLDITLIKCLTQWSSLKCHTLCQNSKVAVSHWQRPREGIELPGQLNVLGGNLYIVKNVGSSPVLGA